MTQLPVTLVTQDADTLEYMHNADYVKMVTTLNTAFGLSYEAIAKLTKCDVSKAQWQQIAKGARKLNPSTRKGVRTAVATIPELRDELPPIPDPVELVSDELIHPDAAMWLVGTLPPGERVNNVLLVAESDAVITINGSVSAQRKDVTPVTPTVKREKVYRPVLPVSLKARVEASGMTVEELLERALAEVKNG